jgi:hypothetical protein
MNSRSRAYYSWTMSMVTWVGVDPRRVRWDNTCPPKARLESKRRAVRARRIWEARP